MKKLLGAFLLNLRGLFLNAAPASLCAIGAEEMPESMKELR
jgi:hypothetical protein